MNKQKSLLLLVTMALMGCGAAVLVWLQTHQKLGTPGIMATPIPGGVKMKIRLPARVAGFTSTNVPEAESVTNMLPKDTSFAQRFYQAPDGFWANANIVLMGTDRTSIHKPEFCLPGQGWQIINKSVVDIPIGGPQPYRLPVAKWVLHKELKGANGQTEKVAGLYVFWFVAHDEETTSHYQRVWWLARDLLRTGVLQRWAYISYFTACERGQEDAAFERMKKLIAASVPEFQLPLRSAATLEAAK